ncbi:hypothetical protein AX016_1239 [Cellulophaga sp. RHA19]|uniref:hypothetical protein n=1 Tax=Cellulophaga sp. RHA19 TaxID=1798237 RepID=UPI000C2B8CB5|nr:hypothetical protein [Cellulophaga sp. RHA19]PKB43056.1 hypothetical protein AX016_1239 [Cellulophaga sp. RHA19]
MKTLVTLLVIFVFSNCFSQDFKHFEIKRLNSFGIELDLDNQMNESYNFDLNTILKKERKRRKNKTAGIIFTSLGALTTSFGVLILSNKSGNDEGKAIQGFIGGMFVGTGIVSGGISIPFFKSTKKRRKERDKLIEKYVIEK